MKKNSSIGLVVTILIFSILFIPKIIDRIQNDTTVGSNRSVKPGHKGLDFIRIDNEARKVPEFLYLNQDSLYISNEDYADKVYLVEFFFTRCPSICPIMNKNMKKIYDIYGHREDFGIASFTIDPEHDTPSVLKSYAEFYVDKNPYWHFLTTPDKSDVYALANKGFNIFAEVNPAVAGGFEHQGYFALIDRNGYIRSRQDDYGNPKVYYLGLDQEGDEQQDVALLIEDIERLLNE